MKHILIFLNPTRVPACIFYIKSVFTQNLYLITVISELENLQPTHRGGFIEKYGNSYAGQSYQDKILNAQT